MLISPLGPRERLLNEYNFIANRLAEAMAHAGCWHDCKLLADAMLTVHQQYKSMDRELGYHANDPCPAAMQAEQAHGDEP